MFAESHLISIAFRLCNALVLIGVCWYIYQRYVRQYIDEKMLEQDTLRKGLEELNYMLEGQEVELDEQLISQKKRFDYLKEKIEEWQEAIDLADAKQKEKQILHIEYVQKRTQEKSERYAKVRAYQQIIPQALAQAHVTLKDYYAQSKHQQEFIDSAMHRIRKS